MDSTSQPPTAPAATTTQTQNDIATNPGEPRAGGSNRGRNRNRRGAGVASGLAREAGGAQETNRGEISNLDGIPRGDAVTTGAKRGANARRGRGRGRGRPAGLEGAGARTTTDSIATTSSLPDRPPTTADTRPPRKQQPKADGTTPAPSRRNRFNAALSTSNPLSASSTPFPPPASSTTTTIAGPIVAPANQTLLERLTAELTQGTYDCSICFSTLSKSTAIHSCTTCHTAFHLNCIEKWATRSCVESAERAAILASRNSGNRVGPAGEGGVWRCPACQSPSPSSAIPKTYTCFCTRVVNPQLRLPITPHSCGGQCARARPTGCKHSCALSCHPGPCPACPVVLQEECHCGKKILAVRCSAINSLKIAEGLGREELLSCREACGKMLGCGLHRCEKECHSGDCAPCEEVRTKRCYCGRDEVVEMCGEGARERIECYRSSVEGDKSSWEGEFGCDRVCDAPFDCAAHKCKLSCHPHPTSTPSICPFSPAVLTHCPCTTTPLTRLLSAPRTSCLAPIPTCASLCPKVLPCGHACDKPCHPGACESCTRSIATVCRCGSLKGNRQCGLIESTSEITCEKVCRAMRNCGRHECGRKCCPLSFQEALKARASNKSRNRRAVDLLEGVDVFSRENDPEGLHTCERVCGRKLGCGIHLCAERDHKGPCGTCLLANFDELICHCGSTIMLPPIACNTTIDCRHPCIRPSTCGHPSMPHACHENENCPPCPFLMTKSCQCGKKGVGNVRCSSKNVSCGIACGKLLRCGFHRCKSTCHPPTDACDTCSQVCLKPLRICSHPCPLDCHAPSTCPTDLPCTFSIEVTCACGNLKQKAKCGSCDAKEEGNRERMIKCSESCTVKKRNDALAEALGIEARERKVREVEYDPMTLSYYSDHPTWCTALETTLTEFINGDKNGLNLPVAKRVARKFTHELAEAFELRSEGVDEEPYRSIMITRQSTSSIPTPTLAEAYASRKSSSSSLLTFGSLRKIPEKPNHHNAILFERVGGYDEAGLRELVRGSLRGVGSFTVEWISNTDVLLHPTFTTPLSSTSISTLLSPLSHLMDQTGFCTSLEGVYSPPEGGEIKRGGAWTTTGSGAASGAATPNGSGNGGWRNGNANANANANANGGARGWGTNLFEALNQSTTTSTATNEGSKSKFAKIVPSTIPTSSTSTPTTETGSEPMLRSELSKEKERAKEGEATTERVEREVEIPDDWEQVDAVATPVEVVDPVRVVDAAPGEEERV